MPEIRQFEALVVVAEERHIGRSAARLGISASSLSERLSRLERSTGVPLVERSTKRVGLTPAGAGVLAAARALVAAWSAARGRIAAVKSERAGVVRVAIVREAGGCAREIAAEVERRLPGFVVETTAMPAREAKRALYYGEIEASVIAGVPHASRCRWNQRERPTHARFVGRRRLRDLVVQWRGSWSGRAAEAFRDIAHQRQREAERVCRPRVDPWLHAREFLLGGPAAAPAFHPGDSGGGGSRAGGGCSGGAGSPRAAVGDPDLVGGPVLVGGPDLVASPGDVGDPDLVEDPDALEIEFDERGYVPI